ncbi:beta-1,3-galactosyltransferase 5-like isoform X2 [Bacillus rossius redtenbacheri]|uniref:beta-1,3-galactosyltransferase 5-like isoform X2 n=1 Tax=Bacillus rossius redtenbacheri TaxID=93214 RepID=UPI002FDD85A0
MEFREFQFGIYVPKNSPVCLNASIFTYSMASLVSVIMSTPRPKGLLCRGYGRGPGCCALLAGVTLLMWLTLCASPPDDQLDWLRHDRNASHYVRPRAPTALLDSAACSDDVRLLLAVASSQGGGERRQAVRDTWGRARPDSRLIFMMGHNGSSRLSPELTREAAQHGDIVVEDFVDNYHNLTLKTLFMLKWAASRCAPALHIMKTGDDVLVNVQHVLEETEARRPVEGPLLLGTVGDRRPQRCPCSRRHLPQWLYPGDVLPAFLSGTGYLMSRPAVMVLLRRTADVPLINLEDVYVTGLLASRTPAIPLLTAATVHVDRPLLASAAGWLRGW